MGNYQSFFKENLDNNVLKNEIHNVKIENILLNKTINKLEKEIKLLQNNSTITSGSMEALESKLHVSVEKLVDKMLANDNVNSSIIPDYLEKKIYTNVFTIFIGILKEIMEDTNINILNQKITFKMIPNNLENTL